jgi:hypothetical protein
MEPGCFGKNQYSGLARTAMATEQAKADSRQANEATEEFHKVNIIDVPMPRKCKRLHN